MCQGRLTMCSLLCAGLLFAATWTAGTASAGPPKIGDSDSAWSDNVWSSLTSWKLPSLSKATAASQRAGNSNPSEPGFTEATRTSMTRAWKSVQRKTRSAWESTKYALRPYEAPPKRTAAHRQASETGGFWSGLFGGNRVPQSEATVNDFLRQPMPQ